MININIDEEYLGHIYIYIEIKNKNEEGRLAFSQATLFLKTDFSFLWKSLHIASFVVRVKRRIPLNLFIIQFILFINDYTVTEVGTKGSILIIISGDMKA